MLIETKVILTGLISLVAALFAMPILIKVFVKHKVYDVPNDRSAHLVPTPSMGGIAFFAGLIACSFLMWNVEMTLTCLLIGSAGLLGLWDDFRDISPRRKLFGQLTIAASLYWVGFSVEPMLHMFFGVAIPNWLSMPLTVVFIAGIMNSFNLLDGIDGLLASVGVVSSGAFAIVFLLNGNLTFVGLSVAIFAVLAAFLVYNFNPASIFMGDTGSLMIGAYISVCILEITATNSIQNSTIALACMVIGALDMLRLFIGRYLLTKQPFLADRNHMHHILMRLSWNPKKIVAYIVTLQMGIVAIGFGLGSHMGLLSNTIILLLVGISYMGILQLLLFRAEKHKYLGIMKEKNYETINNELLKTYLDENEVHFYN